MDPASSTGSSFVTSVAKNRVPSLEGDARHSDATPDRRSTLAIGRPIGRVIDREVSQVGDEGAGGEIDDDRVRDAAIVIIAVLRKRGDRGDAPRRGDTQANRHAGKLDARVGPKPVIEHVSDVRRGVLP